MLARGLVVATALSAVLAPTAPAELPELAGTNTVVGNGSFFMDVRAPKKFDPLKDGGSPVVMKSDADVAIMHLRHVTERTGFGHGIQYVISGWGRYQDGPMILAQSTMTRDPYGLPGGVLRLYMQTNGRAQVTFKIPGLSGERTFVPDRPVPFTGGPLPEAPAFSPTSSSFGASATLTDVGDAYAVALWDEPPETTADRVEGCSYQKVPASAAGPAAYQPGCPGGTAVPFHYPLQDERIGIIYSVHGNPAGEIGMGASYTHAGPQRPRGQGWGSWTSFADSAPVLDPGGAPVAPDQPQPPPPAPAAPAQSYGQASLASARLRARRGKVRVRLRCAAEAPCAGTLGFPRARAVKYRIAGRHSATMQVPFRRGRLPRTLLMRYRTGTGWQAARVRVRVTR